MMDLISDTSGRRAKQKLVDGLPFVHSQITNQVKLQLHKIEKKKEKDNQQFIRTMKEQEALLTTLEDNYNEVFDGKLTKFNSQVSSGSYRSRFC